MGAWLLDYKLFVANTTPPPAQGNWLVKAVKKIKTNPRGAKILVIDAALQEWEAVKGGTESDRIKALQHIVGACSWWLAQKADKSSPLTQSRKVAIERLKNAAIDELKKIDAGQGAFAQRKAAAVQGGMVQGKEGKRFQGVGTTKLSGGYMNERLTYEKFEKPQKTIAASRVHQLADGRDFDQLGMKDYIALFEQSLSKMGPKNRQKEMTLGMVDYLRRADRLRYLVVPHGKLFTTVDGKPYDSQRKSTGMFWGDMYAMDRYGNLFVRAPVTDPNASYFNHSSFNAGNEVICAGMIVFDKGRLLHIDNMSGHYKPDRKALHSCLLALNDQGGWVDEVRVGVFTGDDMKFYLGAEFLRAPDRVEPSWDDRWNDSRKLPKVLT